MAGLTALFVAAGAMPPAGMPRPDPATATAFVRALETQLDAAPSPKDRRGRPALQRLNRTEYGNAIRDLIDLEIDAAALLPPDDSSAGFDNNADLLGVSPAQQPDAAGHRRRRSTRPTSAPESRLERLFNGEVGEGHAGGRFERVPRRSLD
jgi:hypothetical protein